MCNYDGSNDRCLYDTFMDIEYILPFDGNINDIDLSSAIDISEYGRPTYVLIDNNILYYHSYATDIYMQNDSFFRLLASHYTYVIYYIINPTICLFFSRLSWDWDTTRLLLVKKRTGLSEQTARPIRS